MRFTILLPSAEGKEPGGNPLAPDMFDYRSSNTFNYFSDLNPERRALIDALQAEIRAADDAALEKLFGVKGDTLQKAVDANLGIYRSPLMAAVDRYGPGVMYAATDFAGLPTGSQRRLLENGVIFSGLFGLLRPDDLIPDYRLKMDAKVAGIGKASTYWREPLSKALNKLVDGHAVWNLLPASHEAAWDDAETYGRMIRVKFYREDEAGERTAVSHGVKELRGALVAYIVNETADSADALDLWEPPDGYEVDHEETELNEAGGGTVVMVSSPGWETRRAARRKARAQLEAEAAAAKRAREEEDD
ncbi:YaaA family protein [Rubrivirga sp. IMCC45206]|uniref:YaaA family protein n=1 Tax=Rubrivirga sp. IMCC45206 TaxID=3391614 RepID=UPI00398FB420